MSKITAMTTIFLHCEERYLTELCDNEEKENLLQLGLLEFVIDDAMEIEKGGVKITNGGQGRQ